jgi:hypothetical protein
LQRLDERRFVRLEAIQRNEELAQRQNDESLAATANDRLPAHIDVQCECGLSGCTERLPIASDRYLQVLETEDRYLVAPGHELPEVEVVVETDARWLVVEKHVPAH